MTGIGRGAYPELPERPYEATTVSMADVANALALQDAFPEVRRAAYVIFRIESGNGGHGLNNNYVGAQADGGRWPEALTPLFTGVVEKVENGTGRLRLFLAFRDVGGCIAFLCNRLTARGLYVGGTTHQVITMAVFGPEQLARAYFKEWVTGSARAEPSAQFVADFLSMYRQAVELFP